MEKEKKIKPITIIFIVIILVLIILAIYICLNSSKSEVSNNNLEVNNLNTIQNNETTNSEANINEQYNNEQLNEQSDEIISKIDEKYNVQYVTDTITINNEEHTYEIKYSSDMTYANEEAEYYYSDAIILFDNQALTTTKLKFDSNKNSIGKVKTANIGENAVIYIDTEGWMCEFFIVNDEAELVTSKEILEGNTITINGETIVKRYEIDSESITWYEVNGNSDNFSENAVTKYKMTIENGTEQISVLETYKESEVEIAGKI